MDKKVIKQMFADVVSRDYIRPLMMGIHFEENRCYATDTHILVIYNQGSEAHAGKTLNVEGEEIKGVFPAVDRVIPATMPEGPLDINLTQLYKALKWHRRQEKSHADDCIAFGETMYTINNLFKILNLFSVAGELGECKLSLNAPGRPAKLESSSLTAIIMPIGHEESDIDNEREEGTSAILSYETIVNNYAFNGWKPQEKKAALAWL